MFVAHPNSLKALAESRMPWAMLRRCARCGTQPAVTGSGFCRNHGGRPAVVSPQRQALRASDRIINRAIKAGTLPAELTAHPIWTAVHHITVRRHRAALLAAWHSADPAAWSLLVGAVEREIAARPAVSRDKR